MAMRRTTWALLVPAAAVLGCSSRRVPVPPPSAEARTYETAPRYRSFGIDGPTFPDRPTYRWSSGRARLTLDRAHWLLGMHRLDVTGSADGRSDSFLVDTGSTSSAISAASPLAASLRFVARPANAVHSADLGEGSWSEDGALPFLSLGGIEGRDVALRVSGNRHSNAAPSNILGGDVLQAAAIERREDGWWLVTEPRAPWAGAEVVRLSQPGVPVVTLVDATGAKVDALIDTGAPMCIAFADAGPGPWTLPSARGATVLTVPDAKRTGKRPSILKAGGRPFELLVGLDLLDAGTWRLDFERGVWEFSR